VSTVKAENALVSERSDIDRAALAALPAGYTRRPIAPLGVWDLSGQLVKAYSVTAPGRDLGVALTKRARAVAQAQLAIDREVGGLGLGVVIVQPRRGRRETPGGAAAVLLAAGAGPRPQPGRGPHSGRSQCAGSGRCPRRDAVTRQGSFRPSGTPRVRRCGGVKR
jgi:hypothetical protein